MNLSAKNGWLDEAGRVYIIFTIDEIKESLGCAEQKAIKLLAELEKKCGLVKKKRQGLGKPNLLYVKNFSTGVVDSQFLNCENHSSGIVKIKVAEQGKSQCNNTDNKNIDYSDNNPFPSSEESGTEADGKEEYSEYYQYFFEHLEYEYLYRFGNSCHGLIILRNVKTHGRASLCSREARPCSLQSREARPCVSKCQY